MPAEKSSTYPNVTPEEWAQIKAETAPEITAARSVATLKMGTAIPHRGFLTGSCDHSPMMKGVIEFTTAVQALMTAVSQHVDFEHMPGSLSETFAAVDKMMEGPNEGLRG